MRTLFFRFFPRTRAIKIPPGTTLERNTRSLYYEIAWAAILSGVVTFNAAFAVRLGASKELIALLNSIPALVAALLSIPSARFIQQRQNRKAWLLGCLLALRIGYGLVALIPLVFPVNPSAWLVVWIILLNVPAIFFTNGFQALLADIIPGHLRALVFSRRQVIWSIGMVVTTAVAGIWLDRVPFPENYQLMYLFGFLTALGSHYYLNQIEVPEQPARSGRRKQADPPPEAVAEPARLTSPMARMLINMGVYHFGLFFALPLFTIYYIEDLLAPDSWLGLNTAVGSVGVIIGYILWERLLRRYSFSWALRRSTLLTWLYPVLISIFPDLTLLLLFNLAVNLTHPGVDLSMMNIMLKLSSGENRTVYMSWYNLVLNGTLFVAPLVGVWFAEQFGIIAAFLASGALRVLGGVLYNVNAVPEPEEEIATAEA